MIIAELHKNYQELSDVIEVIGYVKSNRNSGAIGFISLTDGTCFTPVQVVYKQDTIGFDQASAARTGATIKVIGSIKITENAAQPFEIVAQEVVLLKQCDEDYPLQKKRHSVEFLREIAHLRPKTNLFSAVMKVRSVLAFAIHSYFQTNNFVWVASPLITSNDGEGAGETFKLVDDPKDPFFIKPACLTVTGQLQAEAYAQAFKNVYTFGPTFRAEKSHTNRHAAEFWMVEPEMANTDLNGLIHVAEDMLKYVIREYQQKCPDEIAFFNQWVDKDLNTRLANLLEKDYAKMDYAQGIEILKQAVANGFEFEDKNIFFGMDLASEHERYLCEQVVQGPLFLMNYPKEIKAFYMYQNPDNRTVAATDLLVPGIGELIGGSQREASYEKLTARCNELNMSLEPLQWYLDLRRYGYYMSSGFGLGFERLIMYVTGVNNIRDVIPFPRTTGNLLF